LGFKLQVLGSSTPVFPGFEVDISDRVDDLDKPDAVWHRHRARAMLEAHPEIKELFRRTPSTAAWGVLFVGLQLGLALALGGAPLWAVVVAAFVLGSWININLFMLAHECNHSLVFKKNSWNRWLFTLTSLPMALSAHHTWWVEHHVHHYDLGAKKDFVKRRRSFLLETRRRFLIFIRRGRYLHWFTWLSSPMFFPYAWFVVVMQAMRSLLGLVVYAAGLVRFRAEPSDRALAILADQHLISGYKRYGITRWAPAYAFLSLAMLTALFVLGGWKALTYILLAQVFMTGFLHPTVFGMILSDSHFHGRDCYQPSTSYYGWRNRLTFNYGLHTEHHDLPAVPWSLLPELRRIAPEIYDPLVKTKSYADLGLRFVFGRQMGRDDAFDNELFRNREMLGASIKP
jgi:sphingolipid delta-4 desaturase